MGSPGASAAASPASSHPERDVRAIETALQVVPAHVRLLGGGWLAVLYDHALPASPRETSSSRSASIAVYVGST